MLPCSGWADLREDEIVNPAPGLWPMFDPLGPTAGPGHPRNGSGLKNSAGCADNQPRRPILSPSRLHFVCFWDRPQKYKNTVEKLEAPHGLPSRGTDTGNQSNSQNSEFIVFSNPGILLDMWLTFGRYFALKISVLRWAF
jgi:hypothetical protein